MYIATNRFKVIKGHEEEFERRWLERDTYLDQLPGFIEFHLLRGPERASSCALSWVAILSASAGVYHWVSEARIAPWRCASAREKRTSVPHAVLRDRKSVV